MAILRMQLDPSVGIPQQVALQPRRRMTSPQFYQQMQQPAAQPDFMLGETNRQQPQVQPNQPQQQNQTMTQDYINSQFQRLAQRPAVPELEPGARVVSANSELVQPSNFKTYYERLSAIRDSSQSMLGAAQARAAHERAKAAQLQAAATQLQTVASGKKATSSSGGQAFGSGVPSNPQANFKYAQNIAGNYGWGGNELSAWYTLGMKESGWRNTAQNPTSTAYGIGQFLNSTWAGVGIAKTSDPATQVEAMARYIKNRYGSPSRALAFHLSHNWY